MGRLDFEPIPELLFGGSVFVGNTGQDQEFVNARSRSMPNARLLLWEAHSQLQAMGFRGRVLFTMAHVDDARELTLALRAGVHRRGTRHRRDGGDRRRHARRVRRDRLRRDAVDLARLRLDRRAVRARGVHRHAVRDAARLLRRRDATSSASTRRGSRRSRFRTWCSRSTTAIASSREGRLGDEVNLGFGVVF